MSDLEKFLFKICKVIEILQDKTVSSESKIKNNPIDIGRCSWALIHIYAYNYSNNPTDIQKTNTKNFFEKLILSYDGNFDSEINNYLQKTPINSNSRDELIKWTHEFHNFINLKLNKPIFMLKNYDSIWKKQ